MAATSWSRIRSSMVAIPGAKSEEPMQHNWINMRLILAALAGRAAPWLAAAVAGS